MAWVFQSLLSQSDARASAQALAAGPWKSSRASARVSSCSSGSAWIGVVVASLSGPQRRACAPAGHARGIGFRGLMEAADQGREHMAVFAAVVIARPIQVGGHEADRIKAVLLAQRFAELQARDLGDRIPLIRGLQRSAEQGLLADRLLGELRIDTAAPQEQQAPHPGAPGRFDHMGLDVEVLQQKICRVAVVGLDAAHLRGGKHHH